MKHCVGSINGLHKKITIIFFNAKKKKKKIYFYFLQRTNGFICFIEVLNKRERKCQGK